MNEFKAIPFEVGDIVTGRIDVGLPASPRNFHPLKDRGKEFAEYQRLEKDDILKAGKFSIKMVFPPHERGRYKIIQGEQYKILVAGKYVFFNATSKTKKSKHLSRNISCSRKCYGMVRNIILHAFIELADVLNMTLFNCQHGRHKYGTMRAVFATWNDSIKRVYWFTRTTHEIKINGE